MAMSEELRETFRELIHGYAKYAVKTADDRHFLNGAMELFSRAEAVYPKSDVSGTPGGMAILTMMYKLGAYGDGSCNVNDLFRVFTETTNMYQNEYAHTGFGPMMSTLEELEYGYIIRTDTNRYRLTDKGCKLAELFRADELGGSRRTRVGKRRGSGKHRDKCASLRKGCARAPCNCGSGA